MERTEEEATAPTVSGSTTTTSGEAEIPDYWQRVDSPFSKSTIFAYAGGMLAFGAVCGAAAALVVGQRPPKPTAAKAGVKTTTKAGAAAAAAKAAPPPLPHTPVKITPSSAVFAFKAFAAGTPPAHPFICIYLSFLFIIYHFTLFFYSFYLSCPDRDGAVSDGRLGGAMGGLHEHGRVHGRGVRRYLRLSRTALHSFGAFTLWLA